MKEMQNTKFEIKRSPGRASFKSEAVRDGMKQLQHRLDQIREDAKADYDRVASIRFNI